MPYVTVDGKTVEINGEKNILSWCVKQALSFLHSAITRVVGVRMPYVYS